MVKAHKKESEVESAMVLHPGESQGMVWEAEAATRDPKTQTLLLSSLREHYFHSSIINLLFSLSILILTYPFFSVKGKVESETTSVGM